MCSNPIFVKLEQTEHNIQKETNFLDPIRLSKPRNAYKIGRLQTSSPKLAKAMVLKRSFHGDNGKLMRLSGIVVLAMVICARTIPRHNVLVIGEP